MSFLVPIAMFGWLITSIIAFFLTSPQKAVVFCVIGGFLFLPVASYDLPGIPLYDKYTAIAIGLILGEVLSGSRSANRLRLHWYDAPVIVWCFLVPLATSLANGLGLYDGISTLVEHYLRWGVFFGWGGGTSIRRLQFDHSRGV